MSQKATTHNSQQEFSSLVQNYHETNPQRTITSHDLQVAKYVQQWVDPAQEQAERLRTRKRLVISVLQREIERMQQQIAVLKAELGE